MDDPYVKLGQALLKMAHRLDIVKLFFDGLLGRGLVR